MEVTTIGLDLGKDVFQVHGITADGTVVFNRTIRRRQLLNFFETLPRSLVGIEACGSAHHWARELIEIGHDVRLMPVAYVKPYVKRGKTDAVDAEAICEAVTRPTMSHTAGDACIAERALCCCEVERTTGPADHSSGAPARCSSENSDVERDPGSSSRVRPCDRQRTGCCDALHQSFRNR